MHAYVALGSNIDSERHIEAAVAALAKEFAVTGISTFYRNPALGPDGRPSGQPEFINGAVAIEVQDEDVVRARLRDIEAGLGRRRPADRYAARTIDLDLATAQGPDHVRIPVAELQGLPIDAPARLEPLAPLTKRLRQRHLASGRA